MSLGNELIKSALDEMDKAHCLETKSEGKKKKPAHGMVIVIGSKAGPGPSTNGKRDDKKDDKKD